jgi:hypothetical protein
MTFKTQTTWDGFFHPENPDGIKLPMPPYTGKVTIPPDRTGFTYGILNDTYKTSLNDLKRESIMYENSDNVKWVFGPAWQKTEYLVAEDGAVLDDITFNSVSNLWLVGSTTVNYITREQAKAAAVLNMGRQKARCSDCGCDDPC